jgi:hypothetical protein
MPVVVSGAASVAPISDGRYPYGDLITIVNRQVNGFDGEGNEVYATTSTDYIGAYGPAIGFESTNLQDQVQYQPGVYLPYVAVVDSYSQVIVQTGPNAGTYEVDGKPAWWKNPHSGVTPGCHVPLKAVSG